MRIEEAVKERIRELMRQQNMTANKLADRSGVAKSALQYTLSPKYGRVQNTGIVTLQKICQAFGITIREFFESPLFSAVEYEEG